MKSMVPYFQMTYKDLTDTHGQHFADDIYKWIFFDENHILTQMSLKSVPRGPTENLSSLVQVMACRQTGDKPYLSHMSHPFSMC